MDVKISEKWIFEPLQHLHSHSFLRGSALFSTRQEAEDYHESLARSAARICKRASEKEVQYRLAKGSYCIRKVRIISLR